MFVHHADESGMTENFAYLLLRAHLNLSFKRHNQKRCVISEVINSMRASTDFFQLVHLDAYALLDAHLQL